MPPHHMRPRRAAAILGAVVCATARVVVAAAASNTMKASRYLDAVRHFADRVLERGRDVYGPKHTPLFVDGLNVDTLKPPVWKHRGQEWILSNLASQQNLLRVLDALSDATGDPKYRQAAVDAIRYAFQHLQDRGGLLRWGGHAAYDALGDRFVGEGVKHELKHHYPYYKLMWQVDRKATRRLIEGAWNAHVLRWDILDVNRHGSYGRTMGKLWSHAYTGGPVPFEGRGLSFMMSGTDLIYAAAQLSQLAGDGRPLAWAKRLAKRYVDARHPDTGLGASNFSTRPDRRMAKQFPQFGGRFTEATVTDLYGARYTYCAVCQLRLGEALGPKGKGFLQWGLEDLTACARHTYDPAANTFSPCLIDGTKLSPADRKKSGYVKVRWLQERPADGRHLFAFALAWKLTKDPLMWRTTRSIAKGFGLGDLGETPDRPATVKPATPSNDPLVLFALLELHEALPERRDVLGLAVRIADNALATRIQNGFCVPSRDHLIARLDDPLPLALLHLRAALLSLRERPPRYWLGKGYFHCPFDGAGRTYDSVVFYARRRKTKQAQ